MFVIHIINNKNIFRVKTIKYLYSNFIQYTGDYNLES